MAYQMRPGNHSAHNLWVENTEDRPRSGRQVAAVFDTRDAAWISQACTAWIAEHGLPPHLADDEGELGEQLTQVLGRWLHDHGYPVTVDDAAGLASAALELITPQLQGNSKLDQNLEVERWKFHHSVAVNELGKLASAITGIKLEPGKEWELSQLAHVAAADLRAVAEAARPQGDPTLAAVHKLVTGVDITPEQAGEWVQRRAPRVWRKGDPEPEDRPVVRGREGSVLFFTHNGFPEQSPEWWCLDAGPNSGGWTTWNNWLARIGPLTEILVDPAPAEGGETDGGQP